MFELDGSRDQYKLGVTEYVGLPAMCKLLPRTETVTLWQQVRGGDLTGLAARITPDMQAFVAEHARLRRQVMDQGPDRNYRRIIDAN